MKILSSLKVLFILILSFSVLCSCSVINKRAEMKPVAANGWEVKTSPATLSGWSVLDISASNNVHSQASYSCKKYKLFLNSIQGKSFSFFGPIVPMYPIYYKNNRLMSVFMLPTDQKLPLINSISDCPEIFSSTHAKFKLEKVSGENHLCRYEFKNREVSSNELKLTIQDDTYNCKIEDLSFIREVNWSYCPFCFLNVASQPVQNYESESAEIAENNTTSTVTINSNKTSLKKVGAALLGGILGAYAGYELANCSSSTSNCFLGGIFYLTVGTVGGAFLGVSQVEDRTGAKVNMVYPF